MICCSDIGLITYFQAEVHATANCPWTRRPAFHVVAYEISGFRVLINQSGNGHSCIRSQNQLPAADALKKQRVVLARDAVLQHLLEKGLELRPRHVVAREEHQQLVLDVVRDAQRKTKRSDRGGSSCKVKSEAALSVPITPDA